MDFLLFRTSTISGLYNIYSVAPKRLAPKTLHQTVRAKTPVRQSPRTLMTYSRVHHN